MLSLLGAALAATLLTVAAVTVAVASEARAAPGVAAGPGTPELLREVQA